SARVAEPGSRSTASRPTNENRRSAARVLTRVDYLRRRPRKTLQTDDLEEDVPVGRQDRPQPTAAEPRVLAVRPPRRSRGTSAPGAAGRVGRRPLTGPLRLSQTALREPAYRGPGVRAWHTRGVIAALGAVVGIAVLVAPAAGTPRRTTSRMSRLSAR